MTKLTLQDLPLQGKKVLMRVDFNVPLSKEGKITDNTRIRESLPSIAYILQEGGSVILMSHLGRPDGKRSLALSLRPCAGALSSLLHKNVLFANDCIGDEVEKMARSLKSGQVLLLENLRFYEAEEKPEKDPTFAKKLAKLGDFYVNDAFGTAHREHSSTAIIAQYFPKKAAAGLLLQKEISFLGSLLLHPKRPFYAIIGGSKVSTKMAVLQALAKKVDGLFIGGGMAYTFIKAENISIGNSIHEDALLPSAKQFLTNCQQSSLKLYLPKDHIIADSFSEDAHSQTVLTEQGIPPGWQGMDVGEKTLQEWQKVLKGAQTIFWNGPLGVFEFAPFAKGTETLAAFLADLSCTTIVGGGDSVAAINRLGLAQKFTHVSTGGGASLEYLEFGHLPGIDALSDA